MEDECTGSHLFMYLDNFSRFLTWFVYSTLLVRTPNVSGNAGISYKAMLAW
jgi:hypothetical protein